MCWRRIASHPAPHTSEESSSHKILQLTAYGKAVKNTVLSRIRNSAHGRWYVRKKIVCLFSLQGRREVRRNREGSCFVVLSPYPGPRRWTCMQSISTCYWRDTRLWRKPTVQACRRSNTILLRRTRTISCHSRPEPGSSACTFRHLGMSFCARACCPVLVPSFIERLCWA